MEAGYLTAEIIAYLIAIICSVLSINGTMKLYRIKHEMFVQKRSLSVVMGLNLSLTLTFCALPVALLARNHIHPMVEFIGFLLTNIGTWFVLLFLNTKNWIVYYKERWTFYALQLRWQQIINKDSGNNNFFIKNNSKYGNVRYMYKIFGIYHLTFLILSIAITTTYTFGVTDSSYGLYIIYIPFIISVSFFGVIVCKTNRASIDDDIFYIHWEGKIHSRILLIWILTQIIWANTVVIRGDELLLVFFLPIWTLLFYSLIHISTYTICSKNYHQFNHSSSSSSLYSSSSKTITNMSNNKSSSNNTPKITLKQVLSNHLSLHLFMIHLSKEFSMECLLSYIEISQFLECLYPILKDNDDDDIDYEHLDLAPETPISSIAVCDENNFKKNAHQLYNKYIKIGTEFEINIHSQQRIMFHNILNDLDLLVNNNGIKMKDIFLLFDKAKKEMFTLLSFSFTRFKMQIEFEKVINLFSNSP